MYIYACVGICFLISPLSLRYDPYLQTRHRLQQLRAIGHQVDKVEFIIMGGTFMSLPMSYRDYFIRCVDMRVCMGESLFGDV